MSTDTARPDRSTRHLTDEVAEWVALSLADPDEVQRRHRLPDWWAQSLASGALGAALLHVHRARTGRAGWPTAHRWLAFIARQPVDDGPGSHLHYGAPALTYVLQHASADHPQHYARALDTLTDHTAVLTRARVVAAHQRIDRGDNPILAEFDAIRGLTGLGALWLRRDPGGPHLRAVLEYLVRLTDPLFDPNGRPRPGWWTDMSPNGHLTPEFPDGHANNGLSHGIAGPLALLALTAQAGYCVPGHHTAMRRILHWYDTCQHTEIGPTGKKRIGWPYWITGPNTAAATGPGRPSWCYGIPGIARAQQLAGIALNDQGRLRTAEDALLTATDRVSQLDSPGLCHGLAGVLLITGRAAADSDGKRLHDPAARLHRLTAEAVTIGSGPVEPGLFEGLPGVALALHDFDTPDHLEWDACLLTS